MIDTADLAILETYADSMNPVERGLLDEVRRLRDEAKGVAELEGKVLALEDDLAIRGSEVSNAEHEVEELKATIAALSTAKEQAIAERAAAEGELEELKARMREVIS